MINIDIVNQALQVIGVSPITSFDEEIEQARKAKQIYDTTLQFLLSEHRWNFAIRVKKLPLLTNNDLSDMYEYCYSKPSDIIKIVEVIDVNGYEIKYLDQDGKIYTNDENAYLRYVFYLEDANKYPPYFVEALKYKLASELSISLVGRTDLVQLMYNQYTIALQKAKAFDAQQGTPGKMVYRSEWLEGR